jgi:hypothetical protein
MNWRPTMVALLFMTAGCWEMGRGEEPIDPFRELEIVDEDIVEDARAKNVTAGPWSFRHLATERAGGSEEVAARVVERAFAESPAFADVLSTWPRDGSGYLDLSRAPMRLIAISNRIDLGKTPDAVSPAGEGRFVFAITRGPADDPSSESTASTIILEYALGASRSPVEWAAEWHALGFLDERESYRRALEGLTRSFADRSGAALARVRASKQDAGGHVALYELAFDGGGDLSRRGLRNTPPADVGRDPSFHEWARAHETEIRDGTHVLPSFFRADVADTGSLPVTIVGVPDDIQRAFDVGTCNGCHRGTNGGLDGGFHVSPLRRGRDRLSRFQHDADDREHDDLSRREQELRALLQ